MKINKIFVQDVLTLLRTARSKTYHSINFIMIDAYWQIGKRIIEEEQKGFSRATYGSGLLKELSKALTGEFGKGFSVASLKNFRKFYLTFPEIGKSYAVRSQLTWTHYRSLMRVSNTAARNYYLKEASEQSWSTRELDRNIKSFYYERVLKHPDQVSTQKPSDNSDFSKEFIKSPYVFEFLDIPEPHQIKESNLERSLIENLQQFMLELGKGFAFVGRQFRISTETKDFYIDLVFYNYILKCFVIFDLKTGELTHQDIGQMDMYVRMFDDLKRLENDKPTIGIILCTKKDETIVKYSVLKGNEQLFASEYKLYLPTEEELINEVEREKLLLQQKNQNV